MPCTLSRKYHSQWSEGHFDATIRPHAERLFEEGRQLFRFDTFGSEAFWGDQLRLHEAVQAVVGVTGFFTAQGHLQSIGFQCALCHSTVNHALALGIGHRLDGFANRDLNVGAIIAAAPTLQPFIDLLQLVDPPMHAAKVRAVLTSWGTGQCDAELLLDGKAFRPDGQSAATMIPHAFGLAGNNNHTWTGAWGTGTYWNAFVGTLELHGTGTFCDPHLENAEQFPIGAAAGLGHEQTAPAQDQITRNLPALHFYQLALPAPTLFEIDPQPQA
jgi:hypothetical protein